VAPVQACQRCAKEAKTSLSHGELSPISARIERHVAETRNLGKRRIWSGLSSVVMALKERSPSAKENEMATYFPQGDCCM
jgi:hypothetical protein